jgi:phage regulator Rha-like protein
MIAENRSLVENLNQEIRAEELRSGVLDRTHFTYSTVAKAAAIRRDNLLRSIDTLRLQLQQVENALAEAMATSADSSSLSSSDAA